MPLTTLERSICLITEMIDKRTNTANTNCGFLQSTRHQQRGRHYDVAENADIRSWALGLLSLWLIGLILRPGTGCDSQPGLIICRSGLEQGTMIFVEFSFFGTWAFLSSGFAVMEV